MLTAYRIVFGRHVSAEFLHRKHLLTPYTTNCQMTKKGFQTHDRNNSKHAFSIEVAAILQRKTGVKLLRLRRSGFPGLPFFSVICHTYKLLVNEHK